MGRIPRRGLKQIDTVLLLKQMPMRLILFHSSQFITLYILYANANYMLLLLLDNYQKVLQEQVSYGVLQISHTFSMDDSGMQTCLQHENVPVTVKNPLEVNTYSLL